MKTKDFEILADDAYRQSAELARRYHYSFRRQVVTPGGVPMMLLLGNHSSGKSSLINWVLGGEAIEDIGVAPTDDGFTVIMYGEQEEDLFGPAALARLPEEFKRLEPFGEVFFHHLRLKVRQRELLKSVALIDSPGMIDAAESRVTRAYDFEGVVRTLAEICDLIFFLFDPEKPGTTGETLGVFAHCLAQVEFKLRVLLNKCDGFKSLHDFARTYGTLCWNLSRVVRTKDLPKIWTLYSGNERQAEPGRLDLSDFNRHRAELQQTLQDSEARRRDNVFAQVQSDFARLSLKMCVTNGVLRRVRWFRGCALTFGAGMVSLLTFLAWCGLPSLAPGLGGWGRWFGTLLVAGLVGLVSWLVVRLLAQHRRLRLAEKVDEIFAVEYRGSLAVGTHDNLVYRWEEVREETRQTLQRAPLHVPFFGEFARHRLERRAEKVMAAFGKTYTD